KKHKPKRKHTQESEVPPTESPAEQTLPSPSNDPLPHGKNSLKLKELMDLCTDLSNKVLELESEVIDINSTYQERTEKLEGRVERLEKENKKSSQQGRKIVDIDVDVEINLEKAQEKAYNLDLDHQEKVLSMMDVNEEEHADVEEVLEVVKAAKLMTEVVTTSGATKNAVIEQVKRNERLNDVLMKYQTLKRKPLTQAQAKRNMILYLKNIAGFKMDYFKGMTYNEIKHPFKKHYTFNQTFLDELNKGVKVLETEVSSKREGESLKQEIAKKQKMEEETEELKKHLQIVTDDDDDDDMYTYATLLASNIPIVDYKIHT
nr:hypothetical protein [Tanacetum cinerariifolium]